VKFLLINSNDGSSFIAAYLTGSIHVKYTNDYLSSNDKNTTLKSPDKLIHCLKFVTEEIKKDAVPLSEIDAVSVIIGPGSFTGIRVGIALAKGIANSLNKKIVPIDNFELKLQLAKGQINSDKYCILIPAKLPEFYYALYENETRFEQGNINIDNFVEKFDKSTKLVGNFSNDYIKKLGYFDILNLKNLKTELDGMIDLTNEKYDFGLLYESEKIEPLYLKDFSFKKLA
jgi:tRNA threonylcarbamoyladenosine biosynthesis protein TsaB